MDDEIASLFSIALCQVFTDLSYIIQYTDALGTHNLEVLSICMISAKIG